jgi:peptidoglycan/xylan/chitin deacetylase (PgdA/CDA1 family)
MRNLDQLHQVAGYQLDKQGNADHLTLAHPGRRIRVNLSPLAALIWGLCDGQRTASDIVTLLSDAYSDVQVNHTEIRADVERVLNELIKYGAIEYRADQGYNVPILLYHKIAEVPPRGNTVWISRQTFADQMATLSAHGFVPVSFEDYIAFRRGTATPPQRPVIITFDDGYESVFTLVRPILKEHGFKATVFLVTQFIGTDDRFDNRWDEPEAHYGVKMLLWSEVAALATEGFDFGSHTSSHPYLTTINDALALRELDASACKLETHLGARPSVFSYPFGDGAGNPHIQALVQDAGYAAAVSTISGIANTLASNIWALPRIKMTEDVSSDQMIRALKLNFEQLKS